MKIKQPMKEKNYIDCKWIEIEIIVIRNECAISNQEIVIQL